MKTFSFLTSDQVTISGMCNNPSSVSKRMLCLHMMPATKESYIPLMKEAEKNNWLAWALDFRGHGESTNKGELDYNQFSSTEHQNYFIDALEAVKQMTKDGEQLDAVIGASIGANIAAKVQEHYNTAKSVLLSPGIDYHGVSPTNALKNTQENQSVLIVSSAHDRNVPTAADMAKQLYELTTTPNKQIEIYDGDQHGTDILTAHKTCMEKAVNFLALD